MGISERGGHQSGDELRGRDDLDLAPCPQVQEVPVAAHDDVGVKGASGLENAVVCRISPHELNRLARLDDRGDPGHPGDGPLDLTGDPAELLAEDAAELGEQRQRCSDLEAPLEGSRADSGGTETERTADDRWAATLPPRTATTPPIEDLPRYSSATS